MPGKISKAQIAAVTKYEKANYDKTTLRMPKGQLEPIRAAAEASGQSVNAYIMAAIDAEMRGQHASMPQPDPLQRAEGLNLTPEDQARAEKAAEAEALDLGAWISRTIKETASREALTREVKGRAAAQPPSPADRFSQRRK